MIEGTTMEQARQRDADRSRAAILDAAEELFAEHGFDVVTMAQVGAAAGVSRGTPGYFFGTKEALYRVVVERAAATLRILAESLRMRDAAGTRTPDVRLTETVDAFLALLTSRASLVRLIDRENGVVSGEPHAEALREALTGFGDDRDRVALIALALCWFPVSHQGAARMLGVDASAPGFVEVWRDVVVAAVGAGLRNAAPAPPAPPAPDPVVVRRVASPYPTARPAAVEQAEPPTAPGAAEDSPAEGSAPETDPSATVADGAPKKKKKKKKKKG